MVLAPGPLVSPSRRCPMNFIPKPSCGSGAVGWGFSSIRVESSGQITSKVVKSPNSESEATRVSPSLKGVIVGQFSAEKGMDEAAMEGAVGGGGGHGLASGAVRVSDLDILRDNPGSAASRAAPGRHDREAARSKPAQPAARTLRRRPGCPVGGEVGVPCQPPPAPLNATTSTRGSLLAAGRDTQRPPSRGRRRRDNDRPAPPGPACKEEAL